MDQTPENFKESGIYGLMQKAFILQGQREGADIVCFANLTLMFDVNDEDHNEQSTCSAYGFRAPDIILATWAGGRLIFRAGCEVKKVPATDTQSAWRTTFTASIKQAEEQAKCLIQHAGRAGETSVLWIIVIGDQFFLLEFGPYTEDQLNTLTLKMDTPGEYLEWERLRDVKEGFKNAVEEVDQEIQRMHRLHSQDGRIALRYFIHEIM